MYGMGRIVLDAKIPFQAALLLSHVLLMVVFLKVCSGGPVLTDRYQSLKTGICHQRRCKWACQLDMRDFRKSFEMMYGGTLFATSVTIVEFFLKLVSVLLVPVSSLACILRRTVVKSGFLICLI